MRASHGSRPDELDQRIAGAPISWGVCEVAGWGYQLAPERVLREAAAMGLRAVELGPPGFLGADAGLVRKSLERNGLRLAAGFLAVVMHRREAVGAALDAISATARILSAAGADVLVLAADTGDGGYEASGEMRDSEWAVLAETLLAARVEGERWGLEVTLHPHYGTMIQSAAQVDRLLAVSDTHLCIDTGHLFVGGADPLGVTRSALGRVRHVHLKDVDAAIADRLRRGELSYHEAVSEGLYRPLGDGVIDIASIVALLESSGYRGWYVLEQDTVLSAEPADGDGPASVAALSLRRLTGRSA
jgi:inosose dehydratase